MIERHEERRGDALRGLGVNAYLRNRECLRYDSAAGERIGDAITDSPRMNVAHFS
jgi:hypothetical protein